MLRAYAEVLALVQLTQSTTFSVPKPLQMRDVITLELVREVPAKMLLPRSLCVQKLRPGPAGITAENAQNTLAELALIQTPDQSLIQTLGLITLSGIIKLIDAAWDSVDRQVRESNRA